MKFKNPIYFFRSLTIHLKTIKIIAFVLLIQLINTAITAQTIMEDGKEFPVPLDNAKQLFYLQRTENTNTIVYELNEQNGVLDTENPIRIFWILYDKKGQKEELSLMEKKMAYGIEIKLTGKENYEFTLVAYPKIKLQLKKDANKKYRVYITPDKQKLILQRVYLKVKEGGFHLEPNVEYIKFSGTDVLSGKKITQQITP